MQQIAGKFHYSIIFSSQIVDLINQNLINQICFLRGVKVERVEV